MIQAEKIAAVMGMTRKIQSLDELSDAVAQEPPKKVLQDTIKRITDDRQVAKVASFHKKGQDLSRFICSSKNSGCTSSLNSGVLVQHLIALQKHHEWGYFRGDRSDPDSLTNPACQEAAISRPVKSFTVGLHTLHSHLVSLG